LLGQGASIAIDPALVLLEKICADEAQLEGILRENGSAHFKERACEINRMVIAINSHHNELVIAIVRRQGL
jgi:hypothetical protein